MMEQSNPPPKKQETTVIEESKGEKATAIAQIEEWGNWKPPQISPANENLQINVGLSRQGKELQDRKVKAKPSKRIEKKHKNPLKRRYQVPTTRKMRQKKN
ncbi:hypothetical protein O181_098458 [Austropuccinia psidii MF-1]|uniref:Uncharacterized protein n=1 Tax=Austropuccinia psidii MF-1 TaxID=1389203 RepID=A0A9Q3J9A5_9BASI|nr:hypothetical protein [Austropuccinia psidii MF-1]